MNDFTVTLALLAEDFWAATVGRVIAGFKQRHAERVHRTAENKRRRTEYKRAYHEHWAIRRREWRRRR
jgi:hypothetical protein